MVEIMAVHRAYVVEAQLLKQRPAGDHAARIFLGLFRGIAQRPRHQAGKLLGKIAQAPIALRRHRTRQIVGHGADRRCDRHVIVVQDDDQAFVHGAGIVHRLIGHAGAHGAVADHRDHMEIIAGKIARGRHAEPGRNRGRAVRGAEGIKGAFRPLGEAGQPAWLAKGSDPIAPAGQDLVGITLMTDIPEDFIARCVEYVVQRHRQLDHAEPGPEMATGDRDRIDGLGAKLIRHLAKALAR